MTATTTSIPMPSTRIGDGVYEVIGTSRGCVVERHRNYRGLGGGHVWKLIVDGQYHRSFDTKRDALVYCQDHPEL